MQRKLKTSEALSPFSKAICQLLSGELSGHLGPYMYVDDSDDHRWKESHSAKSYYLGRDDKTTFDLMCADLNIKAETFFDLGPGGAQSVLDKSLPIMHLLRAKNYYPIDLSPVLANQASQMITAQIPSKGNPIISNFFDLAAPIKNNSMIAIMGGTIANIETHQSLSSLNNRLSEILCNFRTMVGSNGYFIVSFDANADGSEIKACYESPQFGKLLHSCFQGAIDTTGFVYEPKWTDSNYQLALGLRSTRDQIVTYAGQQYAIEKDEYLSVLNSYRFPTRFVMDAAHQSGWQHCKTWSSTGRVHYMLFKSA